ncbi:unnamed protein product [Phytophthora fragariaefolia]|uniref:Unnamed protein product n=1 Tax=Phytophthora fragariaefolia TaxID=1490495 RepID=A0A9W6X1Z7_9STRA|nr:unnamed protein product [Phytophthora fragariaefolia]
MLSAIRDEQQHIMLAMWSTQKCSRYEDLLQMRGSSAASLRNDYFVIRHWFITSSSEILTWAMASKHYHVYLLVDDGAWCSGRDRSGTIAKGTCVLTQ